MKQYDAFFGKVSDPEGKPNKGTRDQLVRKVWSLVAQAEKATETLLALGDSASPEEKKALIASKELTNELIALASARHDRSLSRFFSEKASLHAEAKSVEEEAADRVARLEREFKTDPVIRELRPSEAETREDVMERKETKRFELQGFEIDEFGNVTYKGVIKQLENE